MNIASITRDLLDFIYPRTCAGCDNTLLANESEICLKCIYKLPKFTTDNSKETQTEKIFWGRIPVVQAHSFLRFSKKNLTQKVIHKFKYKNRQAIGEILGRFYGSHLKGRFFNSVDVIIPVPLHPIKLEKRGFNQSEFFAMGLARALNKPIITEALSRRIHSTTQTR
ncbi:MAG: ComF family protein, partial [Bacteroidota bacterium]